MFTFALASVSGVLAGAGHVFTGPDHLAAVAPLALGQGNRCWRAGLMWGIGHSSGVWILAIAAGLMRSILPLEALSLWGERLVGVVLILIGLWTLHTALTANQSAASQSVGEVGEDQPGRYVRAHARRHVHSNGLFGIGALHGVAGASHLMVMLPAIALPSNGASVSFVIFFGVGSILAMSLFSWVIGSVAEHTHRTGRRAFHMLVIASGVAAVGVGGCWLWTGFALT